MFNLFNQAVISKLNYSFETKSFKCSSGRTESETNREALPPLVPVADASSRGGQAGEPSGCLRVLITRTLAWTPGTPPWGGGVPDVPEALGDQGSVRVIYLNDQKIDHPGVRNMCILHKHFSDFIFSLLHSDV